MTTRKLLFSYRYVMKNTRLPTMIGRNAPIIVKSINNHISIRNFSQEAKSDKVQQLTEEILKLSNLEMNQLISALQTRLGVSDDALKMAGSGSGGGGGGAQKSAAVEEAAEPEPVKVKEAFGVKIASVDPKNKLKVIKEIRTLIEGLPIKEAKELVEKAPVVVKEGLKKEEAEKFKKVLTDAGAVIELI